MRRAQDFDKYKALAMAERLLHMAKTNEHPKATAFDIVVATLREKMHVSVTVIVALIVLSRSNY